MTPQQKLRAATTARTLKNRSRPRFNIGGYEHAGLLPAEIDRFFEAVNGHRMRAFRQQRMKSGA